MTAIAANMYWHFTEAGPATTDRIRAAATHGLPAVEMWGWRHEDLDAIAAALDETGIRLLSIIVAPPLQITDPSTHADYLDAVRNSIAAAQRLRVPNLVVVAGDSREGVSREEQGDALHSVLDAASKLAEAGEVTLLLENLNSRRDHVGTYLDSAAEAIEIVRRVGSPRLKVLLDLYHSLTMGEDTKSLVSGGTEWIGHVQIADLPLRTEPGTGSVDWEEQVRLLRAAGYRGVFGMEYMPTVETVESLRAIEEIIDRVDGEPGGLLNTES